MDNLSLTIKERILLIAGYAKLSKIEFFRELGLSYANFKGEQKKSGLSSDALLKVLSKYPELNPTWLLLGEGEMLKTTVQDVVEKHELPEERADVSIDKDNKIQEVLHAIAQQQLLLDALLDRLKVVGDKNKGEKKKKKKKK